MAEVFALKAIDHDNVATVFTNDVKAGMIANVADKKGHHFEIQLLSDVPYGHKIALCDIKKGEEIIKYGEAIGAASRDIAAGDYVHIHNMDSQRGRGDLEGGTVKWVIHSMVIAVLTVRSVSEIMLVLFRVLPAHQMLPQPSADRYRAVSHFRIIRAAARCRRILKELRTH